MIAAIAFRSNETTVYSDNVQDNLNNLRRTCGAMEDLEMQYKLDPTYRTRMAEMEKFVEKFAKEHGKRDGERLVITIPVVVHVVWNTPAQNISDDQILSQIDVMTRYFPR